jgi:hypothetical protein
MLRPHREAEDSMSAASKRVGIAAIVLLAVATAGYLNTAIVQTEGDPLGVRLVLKWLHGPVPFYGGGEEGQWRRRHPDAATPWWQRPGSYRRLAWSPDETGWPTWAVLYSVGYFATVAGWATFGMLVWFRRVEGASRGADRDGVRGLGGFSELLR